MNPIKFFKYSSISAFAAAAIMLVIAACQFASEGAQVARGYFIWTSV
jgi:hypothetical protein